MSNNLVSMDNLLNILKGVKSGVVSKINAKDVTAEQKTTLAKADSIITTGDGTSFLSDNGTYKAIDVPSIGDIHTKTQTVMNLFNISYTNDTLDTSITITMPSAKYYHNTVQYNGKVYCISGFNNTVNVNTVDIYDIITNTWSSGTPIPTAVRLARSHIYNGKIYVIGGYTTAATNIVQIYDIASNTWSIGATMSTGVYSHTSQLYNDKIYTIGGFTTTTTAIVQIYNITNNTWSTGTSMTIATYNATSQLYNDTIYVIGGFTTNVSSNVLIYNITTNTWSTGTSMSVARQYLTSQINNGFIYCIGGNTGSPSNIIEVYNISSASWWTDTFSLPTSKYSMDSIIYNGEVYLFGGYNDSAVFNTVDVIKLGTTNFTLNLPTDLQTKLALIPDTPGDGTKVLADNGTFIDVPLGYRFMTDAEVSSQIATINAYTG